MPAERTIETMDGITLIRNDHRIVEQLFTQYEQANDPETRLGLVAKIIEELSVHADIEERELYPVVRKRLKDGQKLSSHALEEHREAKQVLAELETLPVSDLQFDQKARQLIEDVRHHVEEEEGTHLARLQKALGDEELLELGKKLREAKSKSPARPSPAHGSSTDAATKDELYSQAQEMKIPGRSDMTKDELQQAVADAQSG